MQKSLMLLMISVLLQLGMLNANATETSQLQKEKSSTTRNFSTEGKTYYGQPIGESLWLKDRSSAFSKSELPTEGKRNVIAKTISDSGTDLQGFLKASSVENYPKGWYDVNVNGKVDFLFTSTELMGSCGFVRNDRICQFTTIYNYGYYWFYYSEYDLTDGSKLYEVELSDSDMRNYVINCTYDKTEDMVYMQSYSKNYTTMAWSTFNPETRERTYLNNSLSWDDNRVVAIGADPRNHKIYGIKDSGSYVEINKLSGEVSEISQLALSPAEYSQTMEYAPIEKGFVWAAMLSDNTSGFVRVEPTTGETTLLGLMEAQNQFLQLYCPDEDAVDTAPNIPEVGYQFDGPALTGKITVTLPGKTFGGESISSGKDIEAVVSFDDVESFTLKGKPGAVLEKEVTLTQGEHKMGVKCHFTNSEEYSPLRNVEFYTGYDNPTPPTGVSISNNIVKWTAPKTSVHGGYVDYDNLKYKVYLNDIELTPDPITKTHYIFESPTSLAIYYANVYAIANDMESEPGVSNGVKYGDLLGFPFSISPTSEEFSLLTVVDGNNDGYSWRFFDGRNSLYYNVGGSSEQADEWLIFPKADFSDADHLYRFSFEVMSLLTSRPEDFEIWLLSGYDPTTDQVVKIADYPSYGNDSWTKESFKFRVPESGVYAIAVHCTTPEGFQLSMRNFSGEKTADTPKAPAECKGVTIEGAANGQLSAVATFYAPTKAIDGSALDTKTEIRVIARTDAGEGVANVLPGKQGTVEFPCLQGNNKVILVAANDGGEGMGTQYSVFAGQEKPGKVQNLKKVISDDNLSMTITWDPPTAGESGGYINPDEVGYYIYNVNDDELSFLEDIGTNRSYTYSVEPGSQSVEQLAVGPYNVAGAASSDTFRGVSAILGTPLSLPVEETFNWGIPTHLPLLISKPNSNYSASWGLGDPTAIVYDALTSDYGCMYAQPSVTGESLGRVEIPRISTLGYENACFSYRVYRFPQGGVVRLLGKANDMDNFVEIGEINTAIGTKGYVDELYKLPESLQNKSWIALAIECYFDCESTTTYVIIDEYSIVDIPDNDIYVAYVGGDTRAKVDEPAHFTATVGNRGKETQVSTITWDVISDGVVIYSEEGVVSPLDPEETEDEEFSFTPDYSLAGKYVEVRATVTAEPDDSQANNSLSASLAVMMVERPVVRDLTVTSGENAAALLSWSRPITQKPVRESFESLEDGSYDEDLNGWLNVDKDGKEVCAISGLDIEDAGVAKAWQVVDSSIDTMMTADDGSKLLIAMTPSDESAANDWLISPEIKGGSDVVFSAQILSSSYPEDFELWVSSSSRNDSDFSKLAEFNKAEYGWETYMVTLPADAKYFAIRYCSIDQFGMMIDNIEYVPADSEEYEIVRYNVYKDGDKLAATDSEGYEDKAVTEGELYTYHVTPVILVDGAEVESYASSDVLYLANGVGNITTGRYVRANKQSILISGFAGKRVAIYSVDGMRIKSCTLSSDRYSIHVPAGIYMVTIENTTYKLIVK